MTTREYLRARVIRIYTFGAPIVLVCLAAVFWGRKNLSVNLFVLAVAATYMVTYGVLMRRTPCLRCNIPLRNVALNWGSRRKPAPRCANCGLGIDEQVRDR